MSADCEVDVPKLRPDAVYCVYLNAFLTTGMVNWGKFLQATQAGANLASLFFFKPQFQVVRMLPIVVL